MAISNPLIDDYTLKGAKGLLVNITGGKDLKLFEVDEAVNKVRAEVDPEAELIIGAITDTALDNKMRVSIVATALDGQQPESKSVINMVHRIHNRNPGYSDFSNLATNNQMNLQNNQNHLTDGATALKLDNEISEELSANNEQQSIVENNTDELNIVETNSSENVDVKEDIYNTETYEDNSNKNEAINSNGLENFGIQDIEESTPELFNDELSEISEDSFTSFDEDKKNEDEDDLEIPAFLRRQKN